MTPEKNEIFAENLRNIRTARGLSLAEFAEKLDVPKSTLQAIMEDGQTTLNTAIRIADHLGVPLDTLINGKMSERQIRMLDGFMSQLEWYGKLPKDRQEEAIAHINALIEHMIKSVKALKIQWF